MSRSWIEVKDQRGNPALIDTSRVMVVRDYGDYREIIVRRGGGETVAIGTSFTVRQISDLVWAKAR